MKRSRFLMIGAAAPVVVKSLVHGEETSISLKTMSPIEKETPKLLIHKRTSGRITKIDVTIKKYKDAHYRVGEKVRLFIQNDKIIYPHHQKGIVVGLVIGMFPIDPFNCSNVACFQSITQDDKLHMPMRRIHRRGDVQYINVDRSRQYLRESHIVYQAEAVSKNIRFLKNCEVREC